jgi:WD40 repeat protein
LVAAAGVIALLLTTPDSNDQSASAPTAPVATSSVPLVVDDELTRTTNLIAYGEASADGIALVVVEPDHLVIRQSEPLGSIMLHRKTVASREQEPGQYEFIASVAWSPDGTRLAYVTTRVARPFGGAAGVSHDLWVVNLDGSNHTIVARDATLPASLGNSPLRALLDWNGGDPTIARSIEANEPTKSYSPDRARVAFLTAGFEFEAICVTPADESTAISQDTCLGGGGASLRRFSSPEWSPS